MPAPSPQPLVLLNEQDFHAAHTRYPKLAPPQTDYDDYLDALEDRLDDAGSAGDPYPSLLGWPLGHYENWCWQQELDPARLNAKVRYLRQHADLALDWDGDLGVHVEILDWQHDVFATACRLGFRGRATGVITSLGAVEIAYQTWLHRAERLVADDVEQLPDGEYEIAVSLVPDSQGGKPLAVAELLSVADERAEWTSDARRALMVMAVACALADHGLVEVLGVEDPEHDDGHPARTHRAWIGEQPGRLRQLSVEEIRAGGYLPADVASLPGRHQPVGPE